jgi:CO dehydrogenase nickel-insertion accessory protein CooC1
MKRAALAGTRIGVFGKGGSGKSTVTVFLARALRDAGYAVRIVDADSSNEGMGAALGVDGEPRPLLEWFGGMVFSGGRVTCPVDDPTPLPAASVPLDQLEPDYVASTPEGIRLVQAGKLGDLGPGAGCDGPVAKIARDIRLVESSLNNVTLLDFKAGFEDAARGALTSLDWVLAVVDPTHAAIRMAAGLVRTVDAIRRGEPPATRHLDRPELVSLAARLYREARVLGLSSVLSRVPDPDTERYLRRALGDVGAPPLAVFPRDARITHQWLTAAVLDSPKLAAAGRILADTLEGVVAGARPALPPMHDRTIHRTLRTPTKEAS